MVCFGNTLFCRWTVYPPPFSIYMYFCQVLLYIACRHREHTVFLFLFYNSLSFPAVHHWHKSPIFSLAVVSFFSFSACHHYNMSVPRMYALFFHRLSILERAMDHKCIKECSYSKRNLGRIKCNGPVNFFSERRYFKQHMRFPAQPPPPPHQASTPLLGNPPPPPPQSSVVPEAGTSPALGLRQGRSLHRRVTYQIWQKPLAYMMGQSRERMRSEHRRQEMADSSPPVLLLSLAGIGDK